MRPTEIRLALAAQIEQTITGVTVYPMQPDKIHPPCITIAPSPEGTFIDPWITFGANGECHLFFVATVLVPYVDDGSAWETLDDYLDIAVGAERSVLLALQNSTLDGLADLVHVGDISNYGERRTDDGAVRYLGADVSLRVDARRS